MELEDHNLQLDKCEIRNTVTDTRIEAVTVLWVLPSSQNSPNSFCSRLYIRTFAGQIDVLLCVST